MNFVATIFNFVATMVWSYNNSHSYNIICIFGKKYYINSTKGARTRECRYNKNRHATKGIERRSNDIFDNYYNLDLYLVINPEMVFQCRNLPKDPARGTPDGRQLSEEGDIS